MEFVIILKIYEDIIMFTLIKWLVIVFAIMVAIKIFLPQSSDQLVEQTSKTLGVDKDIIDNSLEKASSAVKEKAQEIKDRVEN
jgi:hypothetical protein